MNCYQTAKAPGVLSEIENVEICFIKMKFVLGDIADALGSKIKPMLTDSHFCTELIGECLGSDDEELKETATWTQGMLGRAFSVQG